jgi:hypothetical protein
LLPKFAYQSEVVPDEMNASSGQTVCWNFDMLAAVNICSIRQFSACMYLF